MAAIGSRGQSTALKVVLASAGVAAAAVVLGVAGPPALRFLAAEVPRAYGSLLGWLTPPYLYFVINGIIISIAASSHFYKATVEPDPVPVAAARPEFRQEPVELRAELVASTAEQYEEALMMVVGSEIVEANERETKKVEEGKGEEEEEEFVISRSSWEPRRRETRETDIPALEFSMVEEKPLVSMRFGHRKSVRPSPEGKALGVARSKRNETLESTWRTITDGRAVPLARHLKKSDTWDHAHARAREEAAPPVHKSETFTDRRAVAAESSPGSGGGSASRLRREPSLGQDDLNRRVEAFIKKFNEEMRLQRQESFQQYLDMINRGAGH